MMRDLLVMVLVVSLLVLAWKLAVVLVLAFAGVLIAVLFRHLVIMLTTSTPLPEGAALAIVVSGLLGSLILVVVVSGPLFSDQLGSLSDSVPQTLKQIENALAQTTWGQFLMDRVSGVEGGSQWNLLGTLGGTLSTVLSIIANLLVLLTIAIFLALDPKLYRSGFLHLVSIDRRERMSQVLDELGTALWHWLVGQSIAMLAVGVLTGVGLWIIGVPLWPLLGLIAGLLNFVPYLGPFLSATPAILVAFSQSSETAIYAVILFVIVQQVEGQILTPIIQKRVSALPPVMIILAVIAFGSLFGFAGVFLAAPLLLVVITLVRTLYVEDVLDDRTTSHSS